MPEKKSTKRPVSITLPEDYIERLRKDAETLTKGNVSALLTDILENHFLQGARERFLREEEMIIKKRLEMIQTSLRNEEEGKREREESRDAMVAAVRDRKDLPDHMNLAWLTGHYHLSKAIARDVLAESKRRDDSPEVR